MPDRHRSPWPGPAPYEEKDWEVFFGRKAEEDRILRAVLDERLVIVTGPSSVGKTSVIRAGVVPRLRQMRYDPIPEDPDTPPVIVLRDWYSVSAMEPADVLAVALRTALDDFEQEYGRQFPGETPPRPPGVQEDAQQCRLAAREPGAGSFVDVLDSLGSRFGRCIVVLDQFEEILRSVDRDGKSHLVGQISDAYLSVPFATILLVLREEHLKDLRRLEAAIGGLAGRTRYLEAIGYQDLVGALLDAGAACSIDVNREAAERIISLCTAGSQRGRFPRRGTGAEAAPDVNLLAVQAILVDLLSGPGVATSERMTIDMNSVAEYEKRLGRRDPASAALENWVDRQVRTPRGRGSSRGASEGLGDDVWGPGWELVVRHVAARLGQFLSSGGYKIAVAPAELFSRSFAAAIAALIRAQLPQDEFTRMALAALAEANLDDVVRHLGRHRARGARETSGLALVNDWRAGETVSAIRLAYDDVLDRLRVGNVIKRSSVRSREPGAPQDVLELVHDGLGRPIESWSSKLLETLDDCLGSLVTVRGVSPIRVTGEHKGRIERISWQGCMVAPSTDGLRPEGGGPDTLGAKARFTGSVFDRCNLAGSVFQDCEFLGVTFDSCQLSGTIFINCRFDRGPDAAGACGGPSRFLGTRDPSVAFIDCSFGQAEFVGCRMRQWSFKRGALSAHTIIRDCPLVCTTFVEVSGVELVRFEGRTHLSHCPMDSEPMEAAFRAAGVPMFNCGADPGGR